MKKPFRPRAWSRPLADLVGAAIHPVLARQGFGQADVILNWDDIVGERLAAHSQPIKMQWPPRPPGARPDAGAQPATLLVRVEGGFAVELQHRAGVLIDRINAHLGWRCVGRLAFRQGPIDRLPRAGGSRDAPSADMVARASPHAAGISDAGLREALTRLGAHVITRDGRTGGVPTRNPPVAGEPARDDPASGDR